MDHPGVVEMQTCGVKCGLLHPSPPRSQSVLSWQQLLPKNMGGEPGRWDRVGKTRAPGREAKMLLSELLCGETRGWVGEMAELHTPSQGPTNG